MVYKTYSLPDNVLSILLGRGTETPFSGVYNNFEEVGTFLCRLCGLALFRSSQKFNSSCGWPSFEEQINNNIEQKEDPDGIRQEIECSRCGAHLGHIFFGESFTEKNVRYCVNSLSLDFIKDKNVIDTEEAILAGGCFWGIEYYIKRLFGVLHTEVGYSGGKIKKPSYEMVCHENTGHMEAVRVIYDFKKINYDELIKYFFEIHDFSQVNGQGNDIGEQYQSVVFCYNEFQKEITLNLISDITNKGYSVATKILPVSVFWPAEKYHQNYYEKQDGSPYCHRYKKIF